MTQSSVKAFIAAVLPVAAGGNLPGPSSKQKDLKQDDFYAVVHTRNQLLNPRHLYIK